MDMTERETRDLMNVESFSQLPFIRPVKQNPGGIRLFGKEFGGPTATDDQLDHITVEKNTTTGEPNETSTGNNNNDSEISSRKFECHYCCRNFPTSQALGGHQNAHKRERQHAKRAHLQSAMVHDYGIMGYNRLGPSPTTALPIGYHSWSSINSSPYNNSASTRLYGSASYNSNINNNIMTHQPINGSPLTTWRLPAVHSSSAFSRERGSNSLAIPRHTQITNNPWFNSRDDVSSQSRFGKYESKPSNQDHVSLDLHL